ncbi:MAG: sigma-70 family RNA polymerase sigma factor [Planctomycetaceae bacterium]|nr:sigma-70 family RNA polymerase sigma factor [Planctomycetaceae bacterium]
MNVSELIQRAKAGDRDARERLFERCRNYIGVLARAKVEGWMQAKFDGSDLVQQTLLEAYSAFDSFDGNTEEEWMAWLRQILTHNTHDVVRHYRADKRDAKRETHAARDSVQARRMEQPTDLPSPSRLLMRREEDVVLADAITQLTDDHQEVIQLRGLQRLSFDEVAERMGRTRPAVQMLWARALKKLDAILSEAKEE